MNVQAQLPPLSRDASVVRASSRFARRLWCRVFNHRYVGLTDTRTDMSEYGWKDDPHDPVPRYSTHIADAWLVVEKLRTLGYEVCLYDERETVHHGRAWEVAIGNDADDYTSFLCDTAPLAICRAALKVVEVA